jgi:hypothetical protein
MSIAAYAALALAASGGEAASAPVIVILSQVVVQRKSIIRIRPANNLPLPVKFKEKKAPSCIRWSNMAAAMVSSPTTIDLIVKGGTRYRVKLEKSCQAIDFYSGFYVRQTKDGQVCQDRDSIHSRSGGECGIDTFKTLVPEK